jgi:superfamily I DNA/RNA helicase
VHFINIFERYLSEIEFDEFEQSQSKVVVSTIHKAKGKELDDVYFCVNKDFFSHDQETDKRLAYVAITRAKKLVSLTICWPNFYSLGNINPKKPHKVYGCLIFASINVQMQRYPLEDF